MHHTAAGLGLVEGWDDHEEETGMLLLVVVVVVVTVVVVATVHRPSIGGCDREACRGNLGRSSRRR